MLLLTFATSSRVNSLSCREAMLVEEVKSEKTEKLRPLLVNLVLNLVTGPLIRAVRLAAIWASKSGASNIHTYPRNISHKN